MYWTQLRFLFAAILLFSSIHLFAQPQTLVIPAPETMDSNGRPSDYFESLLELAFKKTAKEGEVRFEYFPHRLGKERIRKILIQQQSVDLIWSSSTQKREEEMLAIKISLLKGINEYRLLLIREEDQPKFDKVQSLEDLKKFRLGTGTHWSDNEVFKRHQFTYFITGDYHNMFSALRRKRFDFMVRGIHEAPSEIAANKDLKLATENHLLLYYPQPIYFFVNKSNKKLADRITRGLEIALQDGSFDQLFLEFPDFRKALEDLEKAQAQRLLLQLE